MRPPVRLAMWSGPRNISTALMRSWGSRADTVVCDEPLYAHYLATTGLPHPGRDEILAHHEKDWRRVVAWLTGPLPEGKSVFYQKHMAHHCLPDIVRDWLDDMTCCFLIRDPRQMLTSLDKVIDDINVESTGLPQQVELFDRVAQRIGTAPPVLDSRDVLLDPAGMLARLCAAVGVAFDPAMLAWPPGRRDTDGIWAQHWYRAVEESTGFAPYREHDEPVPPALRAVCDACIPLYEHLHAARLH